MWYQVRGFQVAPAELEGHLLLHSSVADCCVVPVPDDYSGELPMAFVVLEPGLRKRIGVNLNEISKLKATLIKARAILFYLSDLANCIISMFPIQK